MSTRLSQRRLAKTASFTIVYPFHAPGTVFTNRGAIGAITATLPTPTQALTGVWYEFLVHAAQSFIVAGAAAGAICTIGNAAANNVSFETANAKVGRGIRAVCDGTQWLCAPHGAFDGFCVNGTEVAVRVGGTALTPTAAELNVLHALASARLIVGSAGNVPAAVDVTGDVTISNAGVTAIGAGKVTSAMLANGAGVAALLTAGLGGSRSCINTEAATSTVVAAHATKDRAGLVVVVIDETYAANGGTAPTLKVGEDDTIEKAFAAATIAGKAAGTVLVAAFTNLATKKIITTTTAKVGAGTGGATITVLAIPTT